MTACCGLTTFCVLVLGAGLVQPVTSLSCDGKGPCRCVFSDGSGTVDVSSLGKQDGTAGFPDVFSAFDRNTYSYNPCFEFSVGGCPNAAACKKVGSDYSLMGKQTTAVWSYTGFYPMVTYTTSDGKKTEVMFICDAAKTTPQLDVIGEVTPGTLSMNLWSNCACANTCKRTDPIPDGSSLTPGSIMLIIFFVLLFVYFSGGMMVNYVRTKGTGRELVPNLSFWSLLPGLIADGFKFSVSCVRPTKVNYQSI
ncbi:cation-dependent mannose-6-phosphate receptor-like [Physella acuta]|uniref:cation-dependent mannose-6-phosphate receptor-like n=1 Tax=Physella acuta TaxID=109671 RepID=UPI0027DD8C06|nr:cation-dependent mannose-6-phosphate receptor-like [Physella acuta]